MRRITTLTAVLIVVLMSTAHAQDDSPADIDERIGRLETFDPSVQDLAFPAEGGPGAMSEETRDSYETALRAYYTYRTEGYTHRRKVFAWQLLSSRITFFIVLGLVFAGIYFAAIQFHTGLRKRADGVAETPDDATELTLSLHELKVRSPVIGIIVLTISLAFFYLYLVHIYPIENIF